MSAWVRISEQLPPIEQEVFVLDEGEVGTGVRHQDSNGDDDQRAGWTLWIGYSVEYHPPDFWMPIPAEPQ